MLGESVMHEVFSTLYRFYNAFHAVYIYCTCILIVAYMKGLIMIPTLVKEADELRQAPAGKKKSVDITLSRDTAELVFQVLNAKASGKGLLVIKGLKDINPSEAA